MLSAKTDFIWLGLLFALCSQALFYGQEFSVFELFEIF